MTKLKAAAHLGMIGGGWTELLQLAALWICSSTSQKAYEGFARLFQTTYARANVGHPSCSYTVLFLYGPTTTETSFWIGRISGGFFGPFCWDEDGSLRGQQHE
jgi:hypothetical protein